MKGKCDRDKRKNTQRQKAKCKQTKVEMHRDERQNAQRLKAKCTETKGSIIKYRDFCR